MTIDELNLKISKKEDQIAKLKKKLDKFEAQNNIDSCLKKYDVSSIDELAQYNISEEKFYNVVFPEYQKWLSYDIRRASQDIAEAEATLAKYRKKLDDISKKNNSNKIEVIEKFLLNWKNEVIDIIKENIHIVDKFMEIAEERNDMYMSLTPEEKKEYSDKLKELKSQIYPLSTIVYNNKLKDHIDMNKLNSELDREVETKYWNMVKTVESKTGKIIDASDLSIGIDGNLNGIIVGESGTVKVSTILAGGYNQNVIVNVKHGQILHHRLIVKKIK